MHVGGKIANNIVVLCQVCLQSFYEETHLVCNYDDNVCVLALKACRRDIYPDVQILFFDNYTSAGLYKVKYNKS